MGIASEEYEQKLSEKKREVLPGIKQYVQNEAEKGNYAVGSLGVKSDGTISPGAADLIQSGLDLLQFAIARNNFVKGWRVEPSEDKQPEERNFGELSMLIVTELSEAFESYRNNEPALWFEHDFFTNGVARRSTANDGFADQIELTQVADGKVVLGKPQGAATELADAIIRILDFADEWNLPVAEALLRKHAYNQTREYRHGGKKA